MLRIIRVKKEDLGEGAIEEIRYFIIRIVAISRSMRFMSAEMSEERVTVWKI